MEPSSNPAVVWPRQVLHVALREDHTMKKYVFFLETCDATLSFISLCLIIHWSLSCCCCFFLSTWIDLVEKTYKLFFTPVVLNVTCQSALFSERERENNWIEKEAPPPSYVDKVPAKKDNFVSSGRHFEFLVVAAVAVSEKWKRQLISKFERPTVAEIEQC